MFVTYIERGTKAIQGGGNRTKIVVNVLEIPLVISTGFLLPAFRDGSFDRGRHYVKSWCEMFCRRRLMGASLSLGGYGAGLFMPRPPTQRQCY